MREKLKAMRIDPAIVDEHPYSICPVEDFEVAIQVMARRSIAEVLADRVIGERRSWMLDVYLRNQFREDVEATRFLFPEVWGEMHPAIAERFPGG